MLVKKMKMHLGKDQKAQAFCCKIYKKRKILNIALNKFNIFGSDKKMKKCKEEQNKKSK